MTQCILGGSQNSLGRYGAARDRIHLQGLSADNRSGQHLKSVGADAVRFAFADGFHGDDGALRNFNRYGDVSAKALGSTGVSAGGEGTFRSGNRAEAEGQQQTHDQCRQSAGEGMGAHDTFLLKGESLCQLHLLFKSHNTLPARE